MLYLHLLWAMEMGMTVSQGIDMFLLLKSIFFISPKFYIQNIVQITILINSCNHGRFIVKCQTFEKKQAELSDLVL